VIIKKIKPANKVIMNRTIHHKEVKSLPHHGIKPENIKVAKANEKLKLKGMVSTFIMCVGFRIRGKIRLAITPPKI